MDRNLKNWTAGKGCLYFEGQDGRPASIPKHFTDLGAIDPVVVIARGRSLFRVIDLLELCSLMEASRSQVGVNRILPHV